MNKKFLSAILSAIIMLSSFVVLPSSAVEVEQEPSCASKKGTFYFDSSYWKSSYILFYIWDETTGEYATKNGWEFENRWGSKKRLGGDYVEDKEGVFESYEVDFSGRDDHIMYIIFHDPDTGAQTYNSYINSSVIGHTATLNDVTYENPVDSEKTVKGVDFDGGEGLGMAKLITSSGKIQGDLIHPKTNCAEVVAKFVLQYLGKEDKLSSEQIVTEYTVADAIAAFGTTADEVWKKYKSYEYDYDEYYSDNYNEAEARKVIKPTSPDYESVSYGSNFAIYQFNGLFGNVDGDGVITSADSLKILRASVNLEKFEIGEMAMADVDEDGSITSKDALEVLRVSVNLSSSSRAGTVGRGFWTVYN